MVPELSYTAFKVGTSLSLPKVLMQWLAQLALGVQSSYLALQRLGVVHPRCQVAPWLCYPITQSVYAAALLLLLPSHWHAARIVDNNDVHTVLACNGLLWNYTLRPFSLLMVI